MRLIIAGSRIFNDYGILKGETDSFIDSLRNKGLLEDDDEVIIISGGAKGADKLGERYAKERGYKCEVYIPDWSEGKKAGILRNIIMGDTSDACIVFIVNGSRGSLHMANYSSKKGLITKVINCYE